MLKRPSFIHHLHIIPLLAGEGQLDDIQGGHFVGNHPPPAGGGLEHLEIIVLFQLEQVLRTQDHDVLHRGRRKIGYQ